MGDLDQGNSQPLSIVERAQVSSFLSTMRAIPQFTEHACRQDLPAGDRFKSLPKELFNRITHYLDPKSLIALSKTCKSFRDHVAGSNGNFLFYSILPPPLWSLDKLFRVPGTLAFGARGLSDVGQILAQRASSAILGGPYDPSSDYKEECRQHAGMPWRCVICFRREDRHVTNVTSEPWGIRLCEDCYQENKIPFDETFPGLSENDAEKVRQDYKSTNYFRENAAFYKPALDTIVRLRFSTSLESVISPPIYTAEFLKIQALKRDAFEGFCRTLRVRIVEAAEKLWVGEAPYPELPGGAEELNRWERDARYFRERWAPQRSLRAFLFPPEKLAEDLSSFLTATPGVWPEDPTNNAPFACKGRTEGYMKKWTTTAAAGMLRGLMFRGKEPDSLAPFTTWANAAKDWHRARLRQELASGSVMAELYQPVNLLVAQQQRHRYQDFVPRLRENLGVREWPLRHSSLPEDMAFPPRAAPTEPLPPPNMVEYFSPRDRAANKYFAKIAEATCRMCPVDTKLFGTGMEELLEHMVQEHGEIFFRNDGWHIVG